LGALLLAEVGAIARVAAQEAEIHFVLFLDPVADGAGEGIPEHLHDVIVCGRRELVGWNPLELAVHTEGVASACLGMEVRRGLLHAPVQEFPQRARQGDAFHSFS